MGKKYLGFTNLQEKLENSLNESRQYCAVLSPKSQFVLTTKKKVKQPRKKSYRTLNAQESLNDFSTF